MDAIDWLLADDAPGVQELFEVVLLLLILGRLDQLADEELETSSGRPFSELDGEPPDRPVLVHEQLAPGDLIGTAETVWNPVDGGASHHRIREPEHAQGERFSIRAEM